MLKIQNDKPKQNEFFVIRRAALTAVALRLLIGCLKSIAKCGFNEQLLKSIRDELLGTDPWKWACVFGGWACFKPLSRVIATILSTLSCPSNVTRHVATIAAGCVVAQPIRLMQQTTRTELGLYLMSRAAHSVATADIMPRLPHVLSSFEHWDAFFVGLSGAQILYALIFSPRSHSPAYENFLLRAARIPRGCWDSAAALHRSQLTPSTIEYCKSIHVEPPKDGSNLKDVCRILHPATSSCDYHAIDWVTRHMVSFSIPLYLPLKIISTLVFGWKKTIESPVSSVMKIASSVLHSSLFLSLYCGGPMRVVCLFSQLGIRAPLAMAIAAGFSCALATLLEPKGRRLDLALYCNMHAFRSAYLTLVDRGYLNRPTGRHVMTMYTISLAVLFHYFRFKPDGLHPNIKTSLSYLLG